MKDFFDLNFLGLSKFDLGTSGDLTLLGKVC